MPVGAALAQPPNIVQDTSMEEKFIGAAAELERMMTHYREKLKTAASEEINAVKIQMGQEAKNVLEKYGLSQEDLARYRREVEKATNAPLKDPEFRHIINKLKQ